MPKKQQGWDLVLAGRYDEAIKRLYEEYEQDEPGTIGSESYLFGVGCAYLLKGEPEAAVQVLEGILPRKHIGTGHYALAGTANWLCGQCERAVRLWKEGRDCQYADAAGGMELPMLLYYAAVRKQGLVGMDEMMKMLHQQLRHPWASCWPGPLGAFVLDESAEEEARQKAVFEHEEVTRRRTMQVDFYVGVKALATGNSRKFTTQMNRCASTPGCELENEYYLARYEVQRE